MIVFLSLLIVHTLSQNTLSVFLSEDKAALSSTYTFNVFQFQAATIPSGSELSLTFPSDYAGLLTDGAYTCSVNTWPTTAPVITCNMASLVLTTSGAFPSDYTVTSFAIYEIVVNGITNPIY